MTWGQIILIVLAILVCCATVAFCDFTIIKYIKKLIQSNNKFATTIRQFSKLLIDRD